MGRGITLFRQPQALRYVPNRGEGFRLRVEAHSADGMPAEIFLHQQTLVDPTTGQQAAEFVAVCSCADLTTYPVDAPDLSRFPQFYRKSFLDIILASQALADDAWTVIHREVEILVEALDKLDILGEGELVRIGEAETAAESMSERAEIREELREESLSSAYRTQVETTVSGDPFFGQFFT